MSLAYSPRNSLRTAKRKPYELAGHFVTPRPAERDGMPAERTHYLDSFEVLVPQDMWSLDEIPEYDENDVVPGDGSWENRIRFAAVVMRHMLNGGQSLTTNR